MQEPSDQNRAEPTGAEAQEAAAAERRRGRIRLTSIAGTISGLLLGACFFLDWVQVAPSLGGVFREGIDEAVAEQRPKGHVEAEFQRLAETLEGQGALTGMDLIHWVRTAGAYGEGLEEARERASDAPTQRIVVLARLLLNVLLFVAFLLPVYFLFHGFRRATSPILILCILVGAVSVVLAGGLHYAHDLVRDALGSAADGVSTGVGSRLLLIGGAGLFLAGTFGVGMRNFVRVYAGAGCTAGALYLLALRYLETGSIP